MMIDAIRLLLFPAVMAFAASSDLLTMTIPNRLSVLLVAGFAALALATGMSLNEIGWHALAGVSVLLLTFVFFTQGWVGGGDAKLAAATALWLGFGTLPDYLLLATAAGGLLTLVLLVLRGQPLPIFAMKWSWLLRLHERGAGVPYGIALAGAALAVYPNSPVWTALAAG